MLCPLGELKLLCQTRSGVIKCKTRCAMLGDSHAKPDIAYRCLPRGSTAWMRVPCLRTSSYRELPMPLSPLLIGWALLETGGGARTGA